MDDLNIVEKTGDIITTFQLILTFFPIPKFNLDTLTVIFFLNYVTTLLVKIRNFLNFKFYHVLIILCPKESQFDFNSDRIRLDVLETFVSSGQ